MKRLIGCMIGTVYESDMFRFGLKLKNNKIILLSQAFGKETLIITLYLHRQIFNICGLK